jgi:hypothetical protein
MAAPYHIAATALKQIIDTEFADLGVNTVHDRAHESLGTGERVVAISPNSEAPMPNAEVTLLGEILVQWYDHWDKEIDPTQQVDPFTITGYADRFRRRVESTTAAATTEVWYFKVLRIDYVNDPTGNKTRFHALVRAYGDNTGLIQR